MATSGSADPKDPSAKHAFDRIGKIVQGIAHQEASKHRSSLKGSLEKVEFKGERTNVRNPCDLHHEYETNATTGNTYPCLNRSRVRFSDTNGGYCYNSRIKGNENDKGACAPYRRLHLCDRNLEKIKPEQIKTTHNLLVDVLLTAKHEGESLVEKHKEYIKENSDSKICTVLARSFADIGDIVRGKDLFLGHEQKKKFLEERLQKMFQNIKNNNDTKLDNLSIEEIREYWWALNRDQVWKAITCKAEQGDIYSEYVGEGYTFYHSKCGHDISTVPTNLDYVPQYLRWFEEWSEDFCRKRKKKLQNSKKYCRDESQNLYCSLNGYDCKETIRADYKLVSDPECTKCSVACDEYVKWIDNEKLQFEKQKKKYAEEISKKDSKKIITRYGKINNMYTKEFYENLKEQYETGDWFLKLLNKEKICLSEPKVGGNKASSVDFTKDTKETFSRTEYCQACPWCGVEQKDPPWTPKPESSCRNNKIILFKNNTHIPILITDKEKESILEKLRGFCSNNKSNNNDVWKCHYESSNGSNNCMLHVGNQIEKDRTIMSYYTFFSLWLKEMLDYSIEWRTELRNCINNNSGKCIKGCKTNCECYKKWVEQKKKEWEQIKKHFHKQGGLPQNYHFSILEKFLEDQFLPYIEDAYGNDEAIETIEEFLEEQSTHADSVLKDNKKDAIDFLLKHEKEDAHKCIDKNITDDKTCIDEDDLQHNNPCAKPGNKPAASVKDIATQMQRHARKQLVTRGSKHELKADASQGTYKRAVIGKELGSNICNIDTTYSNDSRSINDGEPCKGKDGGQDGVRMKIGTPWKGEGQVSTSYSNVYLPPRREHMCTSNLENLDDVSVTKNNKAIHSLLGDVQLAAKMDAEEIIKRYKDQNGLNAKRESIEAEHKDSICRAIRYSFADLGDIIRGRDMWDLDNGSTHMEERLKIIFKKIHETIDDKNGKYKDEKKFLELREDWWSANRIKVWNAMKCSLGSGDIKCGTTPYDDYIPQRLRWMTEWAEWYCKAQSKAYEELNQECRKCMDEGNGGKKCNKDTTECSTCKSDCEEYNKKIDPWKEQWKKLDKQYRALYTKAKVAAFYGNRDHYKEGVDEKDKPVFNFLYDLHVENGGTLGPLGTTDEKGFKRDPSRIDTMYHNAGAYVHDTVDLRDCENKTEFCNRSKKFKVIDDDEEIHENPCGGSSSGSEVNETAKSVAKDMYNKAHAEAKGRGFSKLRADATQGTYRKGGKPQELSNVCNITLQHSNDPRHDSTGPCTGKDGRKERFIVGTKWQGDKFVSETYKNLYIPPRRQHMCTSNLENLDVGSITRSSNVNDSFLGDVLLAANNEAQRTKNHFAGKNDDYTACRAIRNSFADLGDIIRGRDLWDKESGSTEMENNFKKIFEIIKQKLPPEIQEKYNVDDKQKSQYKQLREDWWEANRHQVWNAMQCAIISGDNISCDNHTPYDDYIPQRLRWMTEWVEWYCKAQKKQYEDLVNKCGDCKKNVDSCIKNTANCTSCDNQCKTYGNKIKEWEEQWEKMDSMYQWIYQYAQNDANSPGPIAYGGDKVEKHVFDFFRELHKQNKTTGSPRSKRSAPGAAISTPNTPKTPYSTAAGYIHQEMGTQVGECKEQTQFCSGDKYAFKDPPKEYEKECNCQNKEPPKACDIVDKIFKEKTHFDEACKHKYSKGKEKYTQWKCINDNPSTHSPPLVASSTSLASPGQHSLPANSANSVTSATCIPPRRQQMYTQALQQVGDNTSQVELRKVFIETAAIETFFQWHKFKKEKEREIKEKKEQESGGLYIIIKKEDISSDQDHPQKKLQESGEIHEDFLHQMFYTLADYRDILFGKDITGDTKIQELQNKIKDIIEKQNGDSKPRQKPSDKRADWWSKHGPAIWDGMVCALAYNTDTRQVDPKVKKALLENGKNTLKSNYQYGSIKLDDGAADGQLQADASASAGRNSGTKLSDFVSRPTYFRWLQEWGEEFCDQRQKRLKKIKEECKVGENGRRGDKKCSGYGEHCETNLSDNYKIIKDLECPGCGKYCGLYKRWINKKETEYGEQQKIYDEQKGKGEKNNGFYKEVQKFTGAKDFLQKLGSCKKDNGEDKKIFDDKGDTFKHTEYCDPCPKFRVKCKENGHCDNNKRKDCETKDHIDAKDINYSTEELDMFVSDNSGTGFDDGLHPCRNAGIFDGIRKDIWTCANVCGYNVCKPKKVDRKENDENEIIIIRALFKDWLEYFLEDYNKIRKKLKTCMKNEGSPCIKDCDKKCECVSKWIEKKRTEWEKIKDHYEKQKPENGDKENKSSIKNVLEDLQHLTEFKNAIKPSGTLTEFESSCGSNGSNPSEKKSDEKDIIQCLLDKLKNKIDECKTRHKLRGETQSHCVEPSPSDDENPEPLDDDTSTQEKMSPDFCPNDMPKKPKTDSNMLCDDKNQPKCDGYYAYNSNTYEPKQKLIGLGAQNIKASSTSNVYISPRVQQLCLGPLQLLANTKKDSTDKNDFIKAFTECAYNEGRGLYDYYEKNKSELRKNGSTLSDKDVETYTLEAMKRSYADYGNIVKDDMLWDYKDNYMVNELIFDIANKNNQIQNKSLIDYETKQRKTLWESIRNDIWKAMLCGYKKAAGSMKNLPNDGEFCTLPSTDDEDQFSRWFKEWGENFCIRRDQELNQLKDKCKNGICNSTDEGEKQACQTSCKDYKAFLKNYENQYTKQNSVYNELQESISEFKNKDPLTFLKAKCNSKCLCFKDKNDTYSNDVLKNVPDDVKGGCDCKKSKVPDDQINDLDKCANDINNNNICNKYKKRRMCNDLKYSNSLDHWFGTNTLIPPRRRKICLRNITGNRYNKNNDGENKFKNDLLHSAASEAKFLFKNYEDKNEALQAIKYTFADIGDIIKGNDIMDDTAYKNINGKLKEILGETRNDSITPEKWWEENRKDVWKAMLCAYKQDGREIKPNDCNIPTEENTHQFLRWLTEWGTQYCKEKEQLKLNMQMPCKIHFDKYGIIEKRNDVHPNCLPSVEKYEVWSNNRLHQWKRLSSKFDEVKGTMNENVKKLTAYEYLKQNCSKCICSFKDIEQTNKKSKDEGYHIYEDILDKAQIPSFLEDTAYRYKGLNPECPEDIECSQYGNIQCRGLVHDDDNDWNSSFVKDNKTTNWGVLLPPRRINLCLRIYPQKFLHLRNDINNLKNFIRKSAFAEAKRLKKVYKDDDIKLLEAMKYSFSDIGSVVKGNDMMESKTSEYMDKLFRSIKYSAINRKKWWNENKYHVWESMLCGYREAQGDTKNSENCRFPDIESVPQFLRWFQEWTKIFCIKRKKLYDKMVTECQNAQCDKSTGNVQGSDCIKACEKYKYYVLKKKIEYEIQSNKYNKEFKNILNNKDAPNYLKIPCLSEYFNEKNKWENPYESINDSKLKGKCDCQKIDPITPVVPDTRPPSPPPKTDELPIAADEPFDPTILQTTIPFGVALALGSIAFLFLKKKTQAPVDLFSVINIPKGDYDIPTLKSSNRYIPYASDRYKGKTYIYMEGDSSGDEKYPFMSDTTDVTSSESEYEEMDINDIYVPGSPKYKTLIEVVLEPSKRDIPSSDTPMNKFTDEEWNQLKHDFISNMLQNQPNDVPNDYKSENVPLNTQPNTLYFDKPEEKPFITSIHDRNLYSGQEYNYNVNMVNNDNIPMSDKNVYSGIDLINDSLNNNNVDIYDELLKRKENELFGTNHPKHTNTHSVTKSSNSDPIDNQLDLFHTWLDRHRDMCEKWNNKEEVLDKLKEEWNKDNNSGDIPSDSNKTLNTDVSIQIHMDNPKPINQFNNMDTILEDLDKYNEPYYDVQDDIYYDVNDHDTSTVDSNAMDVPSKVQIEMDVNSKSVKEKYPIADVWDI
ncbi:erythrocyte membrane protein 1, PfEMP1, putative [Plasmodium sp.]|nr:erythrocyte membrane protein 1, PfEMP1, putative [Plasmodium sp.]